MVGDVESEGFDDECGAIGDVFEDLGYVFGGVDHVALARGLFASVSIA